MNMKPKQCLLRQGTCSVPRAGVLLRKKTVHFCNVSAAALRTCYWAGPAAGLLPNYKDEPHR